jgi:ferredoxin
LLCLRSCPANAITERKRAQEDIEVEQSDKEPTKEEGDKKRKKKKADTICVINTDTCVRCGICFANCPAGAVFKRNRPFVSEEKMSVSNQSYM